MIGFRRLAALGERIHGIFTLNASDGTSLTVIHAGKSLYRIKTDLLLGGNASPITPSEHLVA